MTDQDRLELHRLPGLFRRWELAELLVAGQTYQIENAGTTSDGDPLIAIYRTAPSGPEPMDGAGA